MRQVVVPIVFFLQLLSALVPLGVWHCWMLKAVQGWKTNRIKGVIGILFTYPFISQVQPHHVADTRGTWPRLSEGICSPIACISSTHPPQLSNMLTKPEHCRAQTDYLCLHWVVVFGHSPRYPSQDQCIADCTAAHSPILMCVDSAQQFF